VEAAIAVILDLENRPSAALLPLLGYEASGRNYPMKISKLKVANIEA
jgi:hypothetical protein